MFVAVQLRVLFGGAGYVRATTGLGYGEYARHGFVELLLVASLTLAVIAVAAARSRDRVVRALLGVLCVLTLVVMASAQHRLDLVEDAYGATRVRYAGARDRHRDLARVRAGAGGGAEPARSRGGCRPW